VTGDGLSTLRAEYEAVRASLAEARTPAQREPLKRRLMEIYRDRCLATEATRL
jgi:hypothetical protein